LSGHTCAALNESGMAPRRSDNPVVIHMTERAKLGDKVAADCAVRISVVLPPSARRISR
jgi:hypothetical protein